MFPNLSGYTQAEAVLFKSRMHIAEDRVRALELQVAALRSPKVFTPDQLRAADRAQGEACHAAGMADCTQEQCAFAGLMAVVKSLGVG